MMKKSLIAMAALSVMALSVSAAEKAIPAEELGLRKTSLFDEKVAPPAVEFSKAAPGTAKKIERSYVNAPPLIPHSVEGLLPITAASNQCLSCHMPDVAKSVGATPIPESHFVDFRPTTKMVNGEVVKEGKVVGKDLKNTSDIKVAKYKKLKKLNPARYNCSQCHVPQANVKPLVENTFKPEFNDPALKGKSNLLDVINQGVK
jgi:cytochrome c-type protein NapB